MNYEETVNWMFNQLPMYQNQGKKAYKEDLTNILKLATYLNNPENKFKSIHVGGTNGKGSTSHMMASVLQEAGYKVGLYTSPHLKNFTERIRINGEEISKKEVVSFITKHKMFFEENQLSFFEMTVGMAFDYFVREKVDIAIIEVGLGGRLDSTNIITPEVSVITNIGLDHTQILGDTLEKIAKEKAGIIKTNIPLVIGEKQESIKNIFKKKAKELYSEITFASEENTEKYKTDLLGDYQKKNIKTAVVSLKKIKRFHVSEESFVKGFGNVVKNTNLKGRWQILKESPKVICDTAHNKEGLAYVMKQLKKESFRKLHIVLGVVSDKNLKEILSLFPEKAVYYFCKPKIERGMNVDDLFKEGKEYGLKGSKFTSVKEAYQKALQEVKENDLIYVGGSTFVVAEVI